MWTVAKLFDSLLESFVYLAVFSRSPAVPLSGWYVATRQGSPYGGIVRVPIDKREREMSGM